MDKHFILGKKALIESLYKATKIPKEDIKDIVELLPIHVVKVFFEKNPEPKQVVAFGFMNLSYTLTGTFGPQITIKKSIQLKDSFANCKQTSNIPLANKLNDLGTPINKARAVQGKKGSLIVQKQPKFGAKQ